MSSERTSWMYLCHECGPDGAGSWCICGGIPSVDSGRRVPLLPVPLLIVVPVLPVVVLS